MAQTVQASKRRKSKFPVVVALLLVVVLGIGALWYASRSSSTSTSTYREVTVQYGSLTAGVSESASVEIGTVEQTFDLDMSALVRVSTSSSSGSSGGSSMGGGMDSMGGSSSSSLNMFDQIFNMTSSSGATSGEDSTLTVSEVCVSVGQTVSVGDVLYYIDEESLTALEEELLSNIEKALADLEAVYADQASQRQTAEYTYQSSIAYGSYAQTEYDITVSNLEATVTAREESLAEAQASLETYQARLEELQTDYANALATLEGYQWNLAQENAADDVGMYVYYSQMVDSAQSLVDTIEQKISQLEQSIEQAQSNIETATTSLNSAKRQLASGLLTAKETLQLRLLAYEYAQETYDITIAYLDASAEEQETTYAETLEKWETYSSYITGNAVLAEYNGVITSVDLEAGDTITSGISLVTLYDMDEITMTATLDEDDMDGIELNALANVVLTAYPDDVFIAYVSEISDATTDSSGNVTYDVTITFSGDASGLFQGMTGEITFVSGEATDCVYVLKRAVTTDDDGISTVKIKDESGNLVTKEVTIGFSDGVYVEIIEGLSEGDIVIVESKITG